MNKKIIILLSTYNGEKYLKQQLDSLQTQIYKEFEIIARDDGSSDSTVEVLKLYKIKLLETKQNLGAKISFATLLNHALAHSDAEYFMFCDQDDVWENDKVEKTLLKMQEAEKSYPKQPLLIHSDLKVVNEDLSVLADSLWTYQNINPAKDTLNRLLLHNVVTGCTMMINRELGTLVTNIPNEAIMHDWWIAMVASAFGKIAYIDESLMLYRQHGKNDTGAKQYGLRYFFKKFFTKPSFEKYILQSKAFLELYGKDMNAYDRKMLEEFSTFHELTKCERLKVLYKYKIWKNGLMRNIGLVLFA